MLHFSEYVSPGHPDKTCDFISSYLLDEYMKVDPTTRYAVEVQMKNNQVTLAGEISSAINFSGEKIRNIVKKAINEIGYTKDYQYLWGKDEGGHWNTICGDDVEVRTIISQQSSEIAQGVNNNGWGDQGIFFGMATYNPNDPDNAFGMLPVDFAIVKNLNYNLYKAALEGKWGLDIKTGIVYDDKNNHIEKIIVAVPLLDSSDKTKVEEFVRKNLFVPDDKQDYELIINGTGAYKKHSTMADCGTTGRKLAVDFYGGNCKIGGGCVSGDTEYLSPTGWKKISQYSYGDKVAQIDKDFNISFVEPQNYIKTFAEDVYEIGHQKSLKMILSSNHNVFYKTSKGHYHKKSLVDIIKQQENSIKGSHNEIPLFFYYDFNNGIKKYDEWMTRLIVAHCADGTILKQNNWNGQIKVKKQYKIDRLREILTNVNIPYEERNYHDGFCTFYYKLNDTSKLLHKQFENCDKKTAQIVANEVFWWDGNKEKNIFRTTIKEDADFVQFIEMSLSGDVYTIVTTPKKQDSTKAVYIVRKNEKHFSSPFRKSDNINPITKIESQDVYCFTVSTGLLLLRYNNMIFVTGNSPATKDGTKADVALNLYARKLAIKLANMYHQDAYVSLGCCIGKPEVNISIDIPNLKNSDNYDPIIDYDKLFNSTDPMILKPQDVVKELKLNTPIYASMQNYGLFGYYQKDKEWEKDNFISSVWGEPLDGEYN